MATAFGHSTFSRTDPPPSVWPHLFRGAGHEKRREEPLKWSLAFRLYIGSFPCAQLYQDQFIQPGWAERYYAALLPRRGRILRRTLSVCLSVCPYVRPSVPLLLPSVTSRHLANYNDTHVLFVTR